MAGPSLGSLFHIGVDILNAVRSTITNSILFQTGNAVTQQVESDGVESWQHAGFCSVPSNPVAGQSACQGIVIKRGDIDVCIATRDTRTNDRTGNLKAGETCVYASGHDGNSQGRTLYKNDGSITHYTTDTNTAEGKSVYSRTAKGVDDATGAPDGFTWAAPWGTMKFDATGFHVVHVSGAEFHMGGIYGMPAPLDQISSYIKMQAGTINGSASAQSFGFGANQPLALQPAVQAAITALQTQVAVQAAAWAALGALTGPIVGAMIQPVAAAVVTPTAVGTAAVVAAELVMPATTSST